MKKNYFKQAQSLLNMVLGRNTSLLFLITFISVLCTNAFSQCPTNTREVIVVTESEQIAKINVDTGAVNVLCTLPNEGFGYGDIAVSPTGEIYVIVLSPSSTGRTSNLYRVNTSNCSRTYVGTLPFDGGNSLSFLPDGTLLAGSSDDGNTDSRVFRVTDLNNFTFEVWADFGNVYPAGDYVYLDGKIYVAWDVTGVDASSRLFEVTVDENFNYVSHTIVDPAISYVYGLATVCGGQIVAGADNNLFFVDENTGAETPISWSTGALGDVWGLTSYAESDPSVCLSDQGAAPDLAVTNNTCTGAIGAFSVTSVTPPGSMLEYSVDGGSNWSTTPPAYDNNASITLLARYSSQSNSGCYSQVSSVTSTPASCETTLGINKEVSPTGEVSPGDQLTYTIDVTNLGPGQADAIDVVLTDILPEGVTYVNGTAQKTYWVNQTVPGTVETGTGTKDLGTTSFNTTTTQSYTVTTADGIPADATLTSVSFTVNGYSTSDWYYNNYRSDVSLNFTYPGGDISVPRWTFGGNSAGTWNTVTRTESSSVSPFGTYTFNWADSFNGVSTDNYVTSAVITIEWTRTNPDVIERVQTTDAANAPQNMVTAADGVDLKPGETMTITFDVTVDEDAPATLTNTAIASANDANAATDTAENTVDVCNASNEAPVIQ